MRKKRVIQLLGRLSAAGAAAVICGGAVWFFRKVQETQSVEVEPTTENVQTEFAEETSRELQENTTSADSETETECLFLINADHPLPEDYTICTVGLKDGQSVDERCYPDLQAMMDDCRAAGLSPYICSSYRAKDFQERLFDENVANLLAQGFSYEEAYTETTRNIAIPGTSEHESGLAVDIVDISYQLLDNEQENTPAQQWLMENSWRYGFILRYPKDKTDITGFVYEPWHYRYVGKTAAEEIYRENICLEEYIEKYTLP